MFKDICKLACYVFGIALFTQTSIFFICSDSIFMPLRASGFIASVAIAYGLILLFVWEINK